MNDSFGRSIDYIRVSITDRCNLRCVYCMPEEGVPKLSHDSILSYEEILRICRVLAELGVRKVKVTGGEPLVRRGVTGFIRELKGIPDIRSVTLTTNGLLLDQLAAPLAEAGLDGVNISLDTVDPAGYRAITRTGRVEQALRGLDAAVAAGLPSVKVNCVPLAGQEAVLPDMAALARDRDIQVRFIELMPIGPMGAGDALTGMNNGEVRKILEAAYGPMTVWDKPLGNGPARYLSLPGFRGKIGFISAVSGCFCERCNRVRLTADGFFKTCLHAEEGVCLAPALARPDDRLLRDQIVEAVLAKPEQHRFDAPDEKTEKRTMSQIGG